MSIKPLLPLLFLFFTHDSYSSNNFNNVEVTKVYDGDTLTVNLPMQHKVFGKKLSIRVAGIDTPEIRSKDKCEKKAAQLAREFVVDLKNRSKKVSLSKCKRGKYFRLVCLVSFDSIDLSTELIKKSLAYHYNGGKKKKINWCKYINKGKL